MRYYNRGRENYLAQPLSIRISKMEVVGRHHVQAQLPLEARYILTTLHCSMTASFGDKTSFKEGGVVTP